MNLRTVEALIADGYKAEEIHKYEQCFHKFANVPFYNEEACTIECVRACKECGMDTHAAEMIGWNPYYFDRKEEMA